MNAPTGRLAAIRTAGADRGPSGRVQKARNLGLVALASTIVTWSFGPVLSAKATTFPLVSVFVRMFGALAIQSVICAVTKRLPSRELLRRTFIPGVLFGCNNILFFFALQRASVANVSLLGSLQPVVVLLLAGPLFGERVKLFDIICTLTAFAGTAYAVVGANVSGKTRPTTVLGAGLALGSMLCFSVYFLMGKRQNARRAGSAESGPAPHPLTYMTAIVFASSIASVPFLLLSGHASDVRHITGAQMRALLLVIVVPTIGHLTLTFAHRHIDAKISSLSILITPMFSAAIAWRLLDQRIVLPQVVGAFIVLAAVAAVTLVDRNTPESETNS